MEKTRRWIMAASLFTLVLGGGVLAVILGVPENSELSVVEEKHEVDAAIGELHESAGLADKHEHVAGEHHNEHEHDQDAAGTIELKPTKEFTLIASLTNADGPGFYSLNGERNPTLAVEAGDIVKITIVNGEPVEHNIVLQEFAVHSSHLFREGESVSVIFEADTSGTFSYGCTIPGHIEAGMTGLIVVG